MKTKKKFMPALAVAIALGLFTASCSKNSAYTPPPPSGNSVSGVQITAVANFGNIITDNTGRSLYFFSQDASTGSTCVGGCTVIWPVFYVNNLAIGTGLSSGDFGTITRSDGSKQTTYKGWPLYYYAADSKQGDVNGDGVDNNWFVAKADYSVMVANAQLVGLDGVDYNDQSLAGMGMSQYITDPRGQALYQFIKDTHDQNNFTTSNFSNNAVWPIDTLSAIGSVPSILDKTQFGVITVYGKTQLVYKGHPIYYFGQDNAMRGSTKGVSFPTPGAAIWKVVNGNTPAL